MAGSNQVLVTLEMQQFDSTGLVIASILTLLHISQYLQVFYQTGISDTF